MKKEYKQQNEQWLASKMQEPDVVTITKGVAYRVIASGDQQGPSPTQRSIITCHYTGRTIDGKEFDNSRTGVPLAIRLNDLIEGWQIALPKMHVGDRWEIYLSADRGYGKFSQPGIPGGSTLIFDIELLSVM